MILSSVKIHKRLKKIPRIRQATSEVRISISLDEPLDSTVQRIIDTVIETQTPTTKLTMVSAAPVSPKDFDIYVQNVQAMLLLRGY